MTEFLSFDLQQAYNEIKERAEAAGITDKEAWDSMVEDYINERLGVGELDKDEDTNAMIEDLKAKWPAYHENLNIR